MLAAFAWPVTASAGNKPAIQPPMGAVQYDTTAEFLTACTVLPGILATPRIEQLTVSPAQGGELRLQATLEEYFDADAIDHTKWISGFSNPAFPAVAMPQLVNGVLRLDANYVRAREPLGAETPNRFFETSARFVTAPDVVAYADVGFYRSLPPLQAVTETSSIRLFVAQTTIEAAIPRHLFVRSKDGLFIPSAPAATGASDTAVDNWGGAAAAQMAALNQFRTYTIRWDPHETHYLIDGTAIVTTTEASSAPLPHRGISALPTYAFLYSQDPTFFGGGRSPLLVDWVRAGAYAAQGSYTSCVLDAGDTVNWSRLAIDTEIPEGASVSIESRTSPDGLSWSTWDVNSVALDGESMLTLDNPGGRYFQYRVILHSTSALDTPEVRSIAVNHFAAQHLRVNPAKAFLAPQQQVQFRAEVLDVNEEVIRAYQVPVEWSVANGGGTIDGDGLFTADTIAGRFTDTVRVSSPGLSPSAATVSVGSAPDVAVGLCCEPKEGVPITLTAQFDQNVRSSLSAFAWDVNADGAFGDLIGESVVHVFPRTGVYPIKLLVTNSLGFTNTVGIIASIENVAPQITAIQVNTPIWPGKPVTVEVAAVDVPSTVLTYAFDLNGDGVFETTDQLSNRTTTVFNTPGKAVITVRVRDADGGESTRSTSVSVESLRIFLPTIVR
jgi:hypothetical protein